MSGKLPIGNKFCDVFVDFHVPSERSMDSREDLKPALCFLLSRLDQAERIDPKAFPVIRPETHLERIPDKDEVTSSILVSPTRTPASAGVLLTSFRLLVVSRRVPTLAHARSREPFC